MLTRDEMALLDKEERDSLERIKGGDRDSYEQVLRARVLHRAAAKGVPLNGVPAETLKQEVAEQLKTSTGSSSSMSSKYGIARFVVGVMNFFGWATILIGAAWFIWSVLWGGLSLLSLPIALGIVVGGIIVLAQGQMLLATLDTADATRELLNRTRAHFTRVENASST